MLRIGAGFVVGMVAVIARGLLVTLGGWSVVNAWIVYLIFGFSIILIVTGVDRVIRNLLGEPR